MSEQASSPTASPTLERVRAAAAGIELKELPQVGGTDCICVAPADWARLAQHLREDCGFETNTFVTAIDRQPRSPRFEVNYVFLSVQHNDRLRVVVPCADDAAPCVPSITHLWPGTGFSERECFDMFGVRFEGNADLRRLLMPDGYDHHPLRKDFPHRGIEPDRLYREWDRSRRQEGEL